MLLGPCHHGMTCPRVADEGDGLQIWTVAANIWNKQSRTAHKGWSSSFGGLRERITHLYLKTQVVKKCYRASRIWRALVNVVMNLRFP
jgi:hypothetical protein